MTTDIIDPADANTSPNNAYYINVKVYCCSKVKNTVNGDERENARFKAD